MLNLQRPLAQESYKRIEDAVLDDETVRGLSSGVPEELTKKFRERLRGILSSRKPTAIKEQIPSLMRLAWRLLAESVWCPRCDSQPTVRANVTLVEHGYQIDLFVDGKSAGSSCRDFGGDYSVEELATAACAAFAVAMENLEESVKKIRAAAKS